MTAPIYTARFPLPDLLERGRAQELLCPVYYDGELVEPTEAAVQVYTPSGDVAVSGAGTVVDRVATYEVGASALTSYDYGEGWRVVWTLTVDGDVETYHNDAALVRHRLHPVISDRDLYERVTSLSPHGTAPLSSVQTYQPYLDAAWRQIQLRLIAAGKRPWLVLSPSALAEAHTLLTLALIFEDFATRLNDAYEVRATSYRQQFLEAWRMLSFRYDETGDGTGTTATGQNVRTGSRSPIFLMRRD